MVTSLQPDVGAAAKHWPPTIAAGVLAADVDGPLATIFTPNEVSIPVGGSVSWKADDPQDVAFNVPAGSDWNLRGAADGTVELNPLAWSPVGTRLVAPIPPAAMVTDLGSWDGVGFFNTGIIPAKSTIRMTFTVAGRYEYKSLLYDGMRGVINVEHAPCCDCPQTASACT